MTHAAQRQPILRFGVFELDLEACELSRNGNVVSLQDRLFRVLCVLLEQRPRAVSKEDLQERVWGSDVHIDINAGVGQAIFQLREALGDDAQAPTYVKTVKGRGYRFIAAVEEVAPDAAMRRQPPAPPPEPKAWKRWALYAAILGGAAALGWGFDLFGPSPGDPTLRTGSRHFHQRPEDPVRAPLLPPYASVRGGRVAISPKGAHIAYVADSQRLWILDLKQGESNLVDGIDFAHSLVWTPDSEYLLFFGGAGGPSSKSRKLHRVAGRGGAAEKIHDSPVGFVSCSVSMDSELVACSSAGGGLFQLPLNGGEPQPVLTEAEQQAIFVEHFEGVSTRLGVFPAFLPDPSGRRLLLFTAGIPDTPEQRMMILDMDSRHVEALPPGLGSEPVFDASSSHLLVTRGRHPVNLWAIPFSVRDLRTNGEAFLLRSDAYGASASDDGTLVYLDWVDTSRQLVWRDRSGRNLGSIGPGDEPTISSDGKRVAYSAHGDILVRDLPRGGSTSITADPWLNGRAVWSPDRTKLVFYSTRQGLSPDIYLSRTDRIGAPSVPFLESPGVEVPGSWSSDGKRIAFHTYERPGARAHLAYLELDEETGEWTPHVFIHTEHQEIFPRLSPNGRYMAYQSYISGRPEIYLERFPERGEAKTVSAERGIAARWRPDGKELFYIGRYDEAGKYAPALYAVTVETDLGLSVGKPERLFELPGTDQVHYAVAAEGQRFLMAEPVAERPEIGFHVVTNWHEEFLGQGRGGQ